jgi:pilus assembly protein Flp/PilA
VVIPMPRLRGTIASLRPGADEGATAVEYVLMASLIAVVMIGAVTALGVAVQGLFVFPGGL